MKNMMDRNYPSGKKRKEKFYVIGEERKQITKVYREKINICILRQGFGEPSV
jgi:hypothetical protein